MYIMLFSGIFYGVILVSVYKIAAQGKLSDHTLTLAGAIGSVCNGCSRIIWGALHDKFGFKKVYYCILSI